MIADEDTQRILLRKRVSEEARSKGVIKSTTDAEVRNRILVCGLCGSELRSEVMN